MDYELCIMHYYGYYNFVGTKFILPPPGYAVLPLNFTTQNSEGELLMLLLM